MIIDRDKTAIIKALLVLAAFALSWCLYQVAFSWNRLAAAVEAIQ